MEESKSTGCLTKVERGRNSCQVTFWWRGRVSSWIKSAQQVRARGRRTIMILNRCSRCRRYRDISRSTLKTWVRARIFQEESCQVERISQTIKIQRCHLIINWGVVLKRKFSQEMQTINKKALAKLQYSLLTKLAVLINKQGNKELLMAKIYDKFSKNKSSLIM